MAIYIKGMEMPKKCYGCFEEYHPVNLLSGTCKLTGESTDGFAYKRREDCPLIEVPEPHGRLIDADKLYAAVQSNESEGVFVRFLLRHSPTVIEGEVEE